MESFQVIGEKTTTGNALGEIFSKITQSGNQTRESWRHNNRVNIRNMKSQQEQNPKIIRRFWIRAQSVFFCQSPTFVMMLLFLCISTDIKINVPHLLVLSACCVKWQQRKSLNLILCLRTHGSWFCVSGRSQREKRFILQVSSSVSAVSKLCQWTADVF